MRFPLWGGGGWNESFYFENETISIRFFLDEKNA